MQVAQLVKNLPAMQEMQEMRIQSLGLGDPLEESMATHSSSCLENPIDRGAWWATVQGVTESDRTEVIKHTCLENVKSLTVGACLLWNGPKGWMRFEQKNSRERAEGKVCAKKKRESDWFSNLWKMFKVYRQTKVESEERKGVRSDWLMLQWDVKNSGLDSVGNRGSLRSPRSDLCLAVQSSETHILSSGLSEPRWESGIF